MDEYLLLRNVLTKSGETLSELTKRILRPAIEEDKERHQEEWINKYADRIQLLHIKDRMVLGQSGMMNFEQIFKNFYANGHNTFFVEVEDIGSGKQMQRVSDSAKYLLAADFVK